MRTTIDTLPGLMIGETESQHEACDIWCLALTQFERLARGIPGSMTMQSAECVGGVRKQCRQDVQLCTLPLACQFCTHISTSYYIAISCLGTFIHVSKKAAVRSRSSLDTTPHVLHNGAMLRLPSLTCTPSAISSIAVDFRIAIYPKISCSPTSPSCFTASTGTTRARWPAGRAFDHWHLSKIIHSCRLNRSHNFQHNGAGVAFSTEACSWTASSTVALSISSLR